MRRLIAILFVLSVPVQATTISVPIDQPTIQSALDVATTGDTILVEPGTYTGSGNRDLTIQHKAVHLVSVGGPLVTTIDCQGSVAEPHRAISFQAGVDSNSTIRGFTIRNGYAISGGGIWLDSAVAPQIRNCTIEGCQAIEGGAIASRHWSVLILDSCVIRQNLAVRGGALYGKMLTLHLDDCLVDSNRADTGGAVSAYQTKVYMRNCLFDANVAAIWGGAFSLNETYLALDSSTFTNNSATPLETSELNSSGGAILAIRADRYRNTLGPSRIRNCMLFNDSARFGGAFALGADSAHEVEIFHCTFSANIGMQRGGALHLGAPAVVESCAFVNNKVMFGSNSWNGGGAIFCFGEKAKPRILDSEFHGNYTRGYGGAIHFDLSTGAEVQRCTFDRNIADSAGSGIAISYADSMIIQHSCFSRNVGASFWAMWGADPTISNCTFFSTELGGRSSAQIAAYGNCNVRLISSVVSHGKERGFAMMNGSTLILENNDVFANAAGDYLGLPGSGNFSEDPIYCDTSLDVFTLDSRSPCAPDFRPGQPLIGALSVDCSCCEGITGNVSMTGQVDLSDLSTLISFLTVSPQPTLICPEEANIDWNDGIDISDLSLLVAYLISPGLTLPSCR